MGDSCGARDVGQHVEDGGEPMAAIQNQQWTGQQAQLIAQCHAHPALAGVDAEDPTVGHCGSYLGP